MPGKILIVDDDPGVVRPLEFLLKHNGYTIRAVGTGEAALQAIKESLPDLVLLDILLPSIDGFEICQIIREDPRYRKVKIVFMTAMVRDVDVAKGLALGADAYMTKPFGNTDLLDTLKELLDKGSYGNQE